MRPAFSKALTRRATLTREWQLFFEKYAVLLMPVSGELPFPDHLDLQDDASFERVWQAQMPQIGIPFMGLPGLVVSTGLVGTRSGRRADRCPAAIARICALPQARRSRRAARHRRRSTPWVKSDVRDLRFQGQLASRRRSAAEAVRGQVLLIVNTASACGFTPQYAGWRICIGRSPAARLFGARLSLQPVRCAGAGRRQRDPAVLRDQLRRHLSDVRQDRRQRQQCASAV